MPQPPATSHQPPEPLRPRGATWPLRRPREERDPGRPWALRRQLLETHAKLGLSSRADLGYPYLLAACMPAFAAVYLWTGRDAVDR